MLSLIVQLCVQSIMCAVTVCYASTTETPNNFPRPCHDVILLEHHSKASKEMITFESFRITTKCNRLPKSRYSPKFSNICLQSGVFKICCQTNRSQRKKIKLISLFSNPQPEPCPPPPVQNQTETTDAKKSTSEEEPTDAEDKGCDPKPKEQTSEQAKPSSDSRNDEKKHNYKMAFVKSAQACGRSQFL